MHRVGDVEGWQIPGRYLEFLRGGPAEALAEVARHNDQDVRSLGWLLAHIERRLGDPAVRSVAPPGDLAGLARAFTRERRLPEALDCLEAAADRPVEVRAPDPPAAPTPVVASRVAARETPDDAPWWSPRRPADFGGRPTRRIPPSPFGPGSAPVGAAWTAERIAVDRAHLLRRLGRYDDAVQAWSALAAGPGRTAVVAAIELAKIHEHRRHDPKAAMAAATRGLGAIERRRRLGRPEPALEADLLRRVTRLRLRSVPAARSARPYRSTEPTCDSSLGVTARRTCSRARRTRTAARSGTPARPTSSTTSEPAAAAKRRSGGRRAVRPTRDGRSQHGGQQGRQERVAGAGRIGLAVRGGRPVAERSRPASSVPTRTSSPPRAPSVTSSSAPGCRNPARSARLVPVTTSWWLTPTRSARRSSADGAGARRVDPPARDEVRGASPASRAPTYRAAGMTRRPARRRPLPRPARATTPGAVAPRLRQVGHARASGRPRGTVCTRPSGVSRFSKTGPSSSRIEPEVHPRRRAAGRARRPRAAAASTPMSGGRAQAEPGRGQRGIRRRRHPTASRAGRRR